MLPPPNHHHNRYMALFPGPPRWASARRELQDFMVQGKIIRGRHTDHTAGRHSIWTIQCLPPPSPIFLQAGCPSCRPTNSVKALKAICYLQIRINTRRISNTETLTIFPATSSVISICHKTMLNTSINSWTTCIREPANISEGQWRINWRIKTMG